MSTSRRGLKTWLLKLQGKVTELSRYHHILFHSLFTSLIAFMARRLIYKERIPINHNATLKAKIKNSLQKPGLTNSIKRIKCIHPVWSESFCKAPIHKVAGSAHNFHVVAKAFLACILDGIFAYIKLLLYTHWMRAPNINLSLDYL